MTHPFGFQRKAATVVQCALTTAACVSAGIVTGCQPQKGTTAQSLETNGSSGSGSFLTGATPGSPGGPKVKGISIAANAARVRPLEAESRAPKNRNGIEASSAEFSYLKS